MSRSSPGVAGYLLGAVFTVEGLLAECYPEPMTARQIADVLRERGYRWPLRPSWRDGYSGTEGDPTQARVRRVCELKHNRTVIDRVSRGSDPGPARYSIYPWSVEGVRARDRSR